MWIIDVLLYIMLEVQAFIGLKKNITKFLELKVL